MSNPDPSFIIAPLCCGLLFFFLLFAFLVALRFLQYRETLALAEKGLLKPEGGRMEARGNGQGTLRWGVVFGALGLALTLGLWPLGINSGYPLGITPWMIFGFIPLFFGLGLVLVYVLAKDRNGRGNGKDAGGPISS
jgi:hypothetical protein